MAKIKTDVYANIAFLRVTESAPNTLTFAQLQMANTLMTEKAALIIHRIDWWVDGMFLTDANGDTAAFGLSLSDRILSLVDPSAPELLAWHQFTMVYTGVPANASIFQQPIMEDFTSLPGGGLLVPADRIYVGVKGGSLTAVSSAICRFFYTVKPLDTSDYWELIEARRIMTT